MRFFVVASLLLLAIVSTAWQFSGLQMVHGQLLPRADSTETATETSSATTGATATSDHTASETSSSTATDSDSKTTDSESKTTDSATTTTGTHAKTTSKAGSNSTHTGNSTRTTSISVDPRLPAGGISMLTPSAISTTYFKVSDPITFVWNYTSLSITPSAVNVVASCSLNNHIYTITSNMSVSETGSVVWDTKKYQANATVPLLTATYTLIVYDESKDIDDVASAGELSSQTRYYFGMYLPQPYTPLSDYVCATCSSAFSATELQALKFAFGMAAITVASFTWFAGGFGVFST